MSKKATQNQTSFVYFSVRKLKQKKNVFISVNLGFTSFFCILICGMTPRSDLFSDTLRDKIKRPKASLGAK